MSPPRLALVGTDTAVGKTTVACALLAQASAAGVCVLPFKPAQSGADRPSDAQRLRDALADGPLHELDDAAIAPLRYGPPLAPGIADDPTRFTSARAIDPAPLQRCLEALDDLIARTRPDLVLVEPAGGLWVPMPGGTWQPQWLRTLATHTIVIGRAGLGAINAALTTIDALRALDLAPLAFILCETTPRDPSNAANADVIAHARSLPHLGTVPHDDAPPQLFAPLFAML